MKMKNCNLKNSNYIHFVTIFMADRLTGKVQFLNKTAKLEIDIDLPEEMQNMEQVEVDEALFDDLEDLDLEEELEGLE